jgi:hypothetical protein
MTITTIRPQDLTAAEMQQMAEAPIAFDDPQTREQTYTRAAQNLTKKKRRGKARPKPEKEPET